LINTSFGHTPRERLGFQEATDVKTLCNLGIKESLRLNPSTLFFIFMTIIKEAEDWIKENIPKKTPRARIGDIAPP